MKYLLTSIIIITLIAISVIPASAQLVIYPAEDNPEVVIYSRSTDSYIYSNDGNIYFNLNDTAPSAQINNNYIAATGTVNTNWGYGSGENYYNQTILEAIDTKWGNYELPISPILIKATIAVESAFKSEAVSPTGYVGLMQLGSTEASQNGLALKPYDERYNAEKNIKAGLGTLKVKHGVIVNPLNLYADKPWAVRVNGFYQKYGYPSVYQQWVLTLAAYNGGGATVVRAMDYAISAGNDPRVWNNITTPSSPSSSPLYKAIVDIFGPRFASEKYYEMAAYPTKIMNLANIF